MMVGISVQDFRGSQHWAWAGTSSFMQIQTWSNLLQGLYRSMWCIRISQRKWWPPLPLFSLPSPSPVFLLLWSNILNGTLMAAQDRVISMIVTRDTNIDAVVAKKCSRKSCEVQRPWQFDMLLLLILLSCSSRAFSQGGLLVNELQSLSCNWPVDRSVKSQFFWYEGDPSTPTHSIEVFLKWLEHPIWNNWGF